MLYDDVYRCLYANTGINYGARIFSARRMWTVCPSLSLSVRPSVCHESVFCRDVLSSNKSSMVTSGLQSFDGKDLGENPMGSPVVASLNTRRAGEICSLQLCTKWPSLLHTGMTSSQTLVINGHNACSVSQRERDCHWHNVARSLCYSCVTSIKMLHTSCWKWNKIRQ